MKAIKRIFSAAIVAVAAMAGSQQASAQYWETVNQLPNVLSPILSGSGAYKGSVEVMGVAGIGTDKLNSVEIATSQGYQYNQYFYMGAGLGVSFVRSSNDPDPREAGEPEYFTHGGKKNGVMIPVFSDFRVTIPTAANGSAFFIDLRLGASWLCGNNYIEMHGGYLTSNTMFYLRPALGVRIPVSATNPKQAVNIGVAYQLLTANNSSYWYYGSNFPTLSAFGATVSFEW